MANNEDSSSGSRVSRREEQAINSRHAHAAAYPVGQETGLPLVKCPDCNLARVIELRVKSKTPNKGRSFYQVPEEWVPSFLQNPKLCGYYNFQKEYLDYLIDKKVVVIMCEELEDLEEGIEESETAIDEGMKDLEKKLDHLMWKMNLVFVCVGIVVLSVVVKYLIY